jgi:hypothetical protein
METATNLARVYFSSGLEKKISVVTYATSHDIIERYNQHKLYELSNEGVIVNENSMKISASVAPALKILLSLNSHYFLICDEEIIFKEGEPIDLSTLEGGKKRRTKRRPTKKRRSKKRRSTKRRPTKRRR